MPLDFRDPYTDPETGVLRNKAQISTSAALGQFEFEQSKLRIEELREQPIKGKFDLNHLRTVHAYIFQDVYEWAGQFHTVNINKGGSHFAQSAFIESAAKQLGQSLATENNLKDKEKPEFVDRLAHYFSEWNALHPFREGNGRSTREFIGQLAREAGYELDQTKIDNSKNQWNEAARRSFNGYLGPIKEVFEKAIRPSRAIAFEKLPEAEACAKFPELRSAYTGLHAIESRARQNPSEDPKNIAGYLHQVREAFIKRLDEGKQLEQVRTPKKEKAHEERSRWEFHLLSPEQAREKLLEYLHRNQTIERFIASWCWVEK